MTFIKRIFGGSKKKEQELRGSAPVQVDSDSEAIRQRMEAEVLGSKARRDAKAQEDAPKDTTKDTTA